VKKATPKASPKAAPKKAAKKEESSDDDDSSSDEEEEAPKKAKTAKEESSSDEDESSEDEAPKKKAKTDLAAPMVAGGATGRKLFVGGISFDTEEEGLREFFKDCGEIEDVHLPTFPDRDPPKNKRGFAFVTFVDAAGAAEGAKLNDGELDGRWLNIRIAEDKVKGQGSDTDAGEPQLKVYVGGLSWDTTEETVAEFFKDCGETTDLFFPTDRETGAYRGFCFVTFADLDGSKAAVALTGGELDGRWLKINYSQPRTEDGGKGKSKGKGGKGSKGKGKGKGKSKGKSW